VTRNTEPGPPVESPYGHVAASRLAQYLVVVISSVIDDAQLATSAKHPHNLAQSLFSFVVVPDVVERQIAHDQVEGR